MVVEVQVGLGVCDDEVEAEVDAPEGEEETCNGESACVRGCEFSVRNRRCCASVEPKNILRF